MLTKKAKKGHYVVEYINGVDGAYIDLDYIPKDNTKLVCEAKFNITGTHFSTWGAITNVGGASQYQRFHWGYQNGNLVIAWNGIGTSVANKNDLNYHIFTVSKDFVQIDSDSHLANLDMPNLSLWIFSRNADFSTSNEYCDSYCKYVQIFEDDVLVRDYIPVLKDGQYGLFETIQQKYYFNAAETGYITGEEVQIEQYDLEWDYTMGMPEDNGFEKTVKGTVILNMTDDGLSINVYDALEQFVQYALPSNLKYCAEGILETKVIFNAFGSFTEGHRLQLSDGEQGFSVKCYNKSIVYIENTSPPVAVSGVTLETGVEYTIRIERKSGQNSIYLNGKSVFSNEIASRSYTTMNRILFQCGGQYILKSIKFKKIS